MYQDILKEIGLSTNEALVYEVLIKNGPLTAGNVIKKAGLKRGLTYNVLYDLEKKGLLSQDKTGKTAIFAPEHPNALRSIVDQKQLELTQAEKELKVTLPQIISDFNLLSNMPGVRIYEGREGLLKVLADSLTTKTEILTFADIKGMEMYLGRDNEKYVEERKKLEIHKRGIVTDSPLAKELFKSYDSSVTEVRFIDHKKYPMELEMEIYDSKISFMTFSPKGMIGVIIENQEIYITLKSIFEVVWVHAKPLEKVIKQN